MDKFDAAINHAHRMGKQYSGASRGPMPDEQADLLWRAWNEFHSQFRGKPGTYEREQWHAIMGAFLEGAHMESMTYRKKTYELTYLMTS